MSIHHSIKKYIAEWVAGTGIFIFTLISFWVVSPLDPEPYHDGSQLPAAIAVADGMTVHQDVFSAYGFITAWAQGGVVRLFGTDLLTIRYFTAVLVAVVAVLIFILGRWVSRSLWIAIGLAALWVVAWPGRAVIWGTPFLPWPSVVYLVFQLVAVLLLARGLLFSNRRTLSLGVAGAFTGLALLTRINYGAAFALALLVTFIIFYRRAQLSKRHLVAVVSGFVAAIAVPLAVIQAQGALRAFFDQSISGPLAGKAIVKATEWFYIKNAYLWGSALLLISIFVLLWLAKQTWVSQRWFAAFLTINVLGLIVWSSASIEGSPVRTIILEHLTWTPALDGQAMQPLFLSAVISLIYAVVLAIQLLRGLAGPTLGGDTAITKPLDQSLIFQVLLGFTAVASLVQLYPIADPNHLWWAAPLPLILLTCGIPINFSSRAKNAVAIVLVVPCLVVSIFTARQLLERPRTLIESGVLNGMRISDQYVDSVAKVDKIFGSVKAHSAVFVCKEGLFAVWNGTYLANGPGYVDYSYGLESASAPTEPAQTFLCVPIGDTTTAPQFAKAHNLQIVGETGAVHLSYFTDVNIVELAQK